MATTRARALLRNRYNCMLLFEHREGVQFIVFDTETTGTKNEVDYIVQIAAKKYRVERMLQQGQTVCDIRETDSLNIYIRPPVMMSDKVISVHHITNEFLQDKPDEEEVFGQVRAFFGERPILVGYNISFDIGFMKAYYERQDKEFSYAVALDVLEMARDTISGPDVTSYKQEALLAMYSLDAGLQAHSALDDTEGCARLLRLCYRLYKENPPRTDRSKAYVTNIWYNNADDRNHMQKGIWCRIKNSAGGKVHIYYSTFRKAWYSAQLDLSRVDVDELQAYVLGRLGVDYDTFSRMTQKKFLELKEAGKF